MSDAGNVITFKPADKTYWVCICGCITHYLRDDGFIECGSCHGVSDEVGGEWRKRLPITNENAEVKTDAVRVTDLNSAHAAIRSALLKANPETLRALFMIFQDGKISAWSDITTEDQLDWLQRRTVDALSMVEPKVHRR